MSRDFHSYQRETPSGWVTYDQTTLSQQLLLEEAAKHGISYSEIPGTRIFELQYKDIKRYFRAQVPNQTTYIGWYSANFKNVTRHMLQNANLSVPKGYFVMPQDTLEDKLAVFRALQKPVVAKPSNGGHGKDVFTNITDEEYYLHALDVCLDSNDDRLVGVIVEEMFKGEEYRILATTDKVIGIINRKPANVVGDGTHTIRELIENKNKDPRRSDSYKTSLITIKIDEHVEETLKKNAYTLDTVPAQDEVVYLRHNSNLSTGGDSIDVTDIAHPSVKEIAIKVMQTIKGLEYGGIDFMTKDITQAQTPDSYCIIEVNDSPMLSMHEVPYMGESRSAAKEFLLILFPELKNS